MTEDEARDWLAAQYPATTIARLERYVVRLSAEATRQSLIAKSTLASIWSRHIVDSAQLVGLGAATSCWLDVGSGGGLPGIVVAILRDGPIVMSEPRRKRAEFLALTLEELGLKHASVQQVSVQDLEVDAAVVSARAVASIPDIFTWTRRSVSRETQFILPRGRCWAGELAIAQRTWHGEFHVEQSVTDPESGIVVARAVMRR